MADTKDKRINVSGTVTPALHEFIENYRWSNRKSKSDVINEALLSWAKGNGFTEPATGETPAEGDAKAAEAAKPAEAPEVVKAGARRAS